MRLFYHTNFFTKLSKPRSHLFGIMYFSSPTVDFTCRKPFHHNFSALKQFRPQFYFLTFANSEAIIRAGLVGVNIKAFKSIASYNTF